VLLQFPDYINFENRRTRHC